MSRITRREFLTTTAAGAAAAAGGTLPFGARAGAQPARRKRPNVLFVFYDQLRADVCGAYGGVKNIETPHLDRLAAQSITFKRSLSTTPVCTPYRGMLLTGRYPTHSGVLLNWTEASPRQNPISIATTFRDAGYNTGFIGKWHLSGGAKKMDGKFEPDMARRREYLARTPEPEFTPPGPDRFGYEHWETYNFHVAFNNYYYYRDEPKRIEPEGFESDIQTDQAIDYMRRHKDDERPFFLVVAPHPPHPPFRHPSHTPAGYFEKIPPNLNWAPNVPQDHERRTNQAQARCYYAMSKNADDNMGRLLKFMDESGLSDDTIVVFTSDHGEMNGSHGRINKMMPYAESVDVPLFIRWPGHIAPGSKTEALFTPLDHLPTLCGLTGIGRAPHTCDGLDMSDVALGRSNTSRDSVLIANYISHWDYFQTGTLWPEWRGVHTGQYTYVKWLTGHEELYDNHEDRYQMRNLAEHQQHLPVIKKCREQMADYMAASHDEFMPGNAFAEWFDDERNLVKTALGPVGG